jgi:hypothetical protein
MRTDYSFGFRLPSFSETYDYSDRKPRTKPNAALEALHAIVSMIDNCGDVTRAPDSLPMMVMQTARAAIDQETKVS